MAVPMVGLMKRVHIIAVIGIITPAAVGQMANLTANQAVYTAVAIILAAVVAALGTTADVLGHVNNQVAALLEPIGTTVPGAVIMAKFVV